MLNYFMDLIITSQTCDDREWFSPNSNKEAKFIL